MQLIMAAVPDADSFACPPLPDVSTIAGKGNLVFVGPEEKYGGADASSAALIQRFNPAHSAVVLAKGCTTVVTNDIQPPTEALTQYSCGKLTECLDLMIFYFPLFTSALVDSLWTKFASNLKPNGQLIFPITCLLSLGTIDVKFSQDPKQQGTVQCPADSEERLRQCSWAQVMTNMSVLDDVDNNLGDFTYIENEEERDADGTLQVSAHAVNQEWKNRFIAVCRPEVARSFGVGFSVEMSIAQPYPIGGCNAAYNDSHCVFATVTRKDVHAAVAAN